MAKVTIVPAKEAKNHFGELLDAAQHAPVIITRNGQPVAILTRHKRSARFKEVTDKTMLAWVSHLEKKR